MPRTVPQLVSAPPAHAPVEPRPGRDGLTFILTAHRAPAAVIAAGLSHMHQHRLTPTASRGIVGSMTAFTYLADAHRGTAIAPDLLELSMQFATAPCGPLHGRHISPDRELAALLASAG